MHCLARNPWPGNVRELANLLERLAILFPEQTITRRRPAGALSQHAARCAGSAASVRIDADASRRAARATARSGRRAVDDESRGELRSREAST